MNKTKPEESQRDAWQTLSAATERVLSREEKQNYKRTEVSRSRDQDEQRDTEQRDYIAYRLREAVAFERRASGPAIKRRIRN